MASRVEQLPPRPDPAHAGKPGTAGCERSGRRSSGDPRRPSGAEPPRPQESPEPDPGPEVLRPGTRLLLVQEIRRRGKGICAGLSELPRGSALPLLSRTV